MCRQNQLQTDSSSEDNTSDLSVLDRHRRRRRKYNSISLDKKNILIQFYEDGKTIVESVVIADINKNTATAIINRYKKDECIGGKRHSKINARIINKIEEIVERKPSISLKDISKEIVEVHNVTLSTTTTHNALKSFRITLKNSTINVDRLNSEAIIQRRIPYALNFVQNTPERRE